MTKGVGKPHSNNGKNAALSEESEVMKGLRAFMEELKSHGEVRATRLVEILVAEEVSGHSNCDHAIEDIYLPICLGYRPCYACYLNDLGLTINSHSDGSYTVTEAEGGGYLPFSTFFCIWKRDYSMLKVSRPVEGICKQCFGFSHRSKILVTAAPSNDSATSPIMLNSSIDDILFWPEHNESIETEESIADSDDDYDLQTPAAGDTPDNHTTIPTVVESTIEDKVVDEEKAADDADDTREQLMLRMGEHVKMARVQRALYQQYVAKSVLDCVGDTPHSKYGIASL